MSEQQCPQVYKAIATITRDIGRSGIGKNRTAQGYKFRGIDDVLNALSPLLAEHSLCIIPRIVARTQEERAAKSGGALFYTAVTAEFDFVSAIDGSKHTACTIGEAMDSSDKSTNKAMSAAYKYACFMTFCIPLEGTPDADADTPEPMARNEGLQESQVIDLLATINEAPDSDALKKAWTTAHATAKNAGDARAVDRFIAAKDNRKAALAEAKKS